MDILLTNTGRRTYFIKYLISLTKYYKKLKIHVSDSNIISPALNFNSKKIKKHLLPKIRNNKEKYLNKLINVVKKNKIRLIIPLADYDLEILAEKKNKFKELNCEVVISSHELVKNFLNKKFTYLLCKKNKIKTPRVWLDIKELKRNFKKKIFVRKHIYGSASSGFLILDNKIKYSFFKKGRDIIQEHISGTELHFDILNDLNGKFLGACVKKKILMRSGETDKAETIFKKSYIDLAKRISNSFRHIGNLDCDAIEDNRGNLYWVDFNPRFGGGYPFTHLSGYNFLKAIIDSKLKKKINLPKKPKLIRAAKGIDVYASS